MAWVILTLRASVNCGLLALTCDFGKHHKKRSPVTDSFTNVLFERVRTDDASKQTALSMVTNFELLDQLDLCAGADPSTDAKLVKLKPAKGRVLVRGKELTASGSLAHFHG
ncbi:hypothetical protein Trydic_g4288 [Trypoxylus dichotomus]